MKKQTVQKEVFITEDGKEFDNEKEAVKHESKISIFKQLEKLKPQGKQYHAVYINWFIAPDQTKLKDTVNFDALNITNKNCAKIPGWNLIEDNGDSSVIIPIEQLMQMFTTPTPRQATITTDEQKNVLQLKRALHNIVLRNTQQEGTPQALLGNLLMDLQDFLKQ